MAVAASSRALWSRIGPRSRPKALPRSALYFPYYCCWWWWWCGVGVGISVGVVVAAVVVFSDDVVGFVVVVAASR